MKRICKFCEEGFSRKGRGLYCSDSCRKKDYLLRREQAKIHKSNKPRNIQTLCWKCNKCYGGCSWSNLTFTPVKGWNAIRSVGVNDLGLTYDSYTVIECPEFEQDRRFK